MASSPHHQTGGVSPVAHGSPGSVRAHAGDHAAQEDVITVSPTRPARTDAQRERQERWKTPPPVPRGATEVRRASPAGGAGSTSGAGGIALPAMGASSVGVGAWRSASPVSRRQPPSPSLQSLRRELREARWQDSVPATADNSVHASQRVYFSGKSFVHPIVSTEPGVAGSTAPSDGGMRGAGIPVARRRKIKRVKRRRHRSKRRDGSSGGDEAGLEELEEDASTLHPDGSAGGSSGGESGSRGAHEAGGPETFALPAVASAAPTPQASSASSRRTPIRSGVRPMPVLPPSPAARGGSSGSGSAGAGAGGSEGGSTGAGPVRAAADTDKRGQKRGRNIGTIEELRAAEKERREMVRKRKAERAASKQAAAALMLTGAESPSVRAAIAEEAEARKERAALLRRPGSTDRLHAEAQARKREQRIRDKAIQAAEARKRAAFQLVLEVWGSNGNKVLASPPKGGAGAAATTAGTNRAQGAAKSDGASPAKGAPGAGSAAEAESIAAASRAAALAPVRERLKTAGGSTTDYSESGSDYGDDFEDDSPRSPSPKRAATAKTGQMEATPTPKDQARESETEAAGHGDGGEKPTATDGEVASGKAKSPVRSGAGPPPMIPLLPFRVEGAFVEVLEFKTDAVGAPMLGKVLASGRSDAWGKCTVKGHYAAWRNRPVWLRVSCEGLVTLGTRLRLAGKVTRKSVQLNTVEHAEEMMKRERAQQRYFAKVAAKFMLRMHVSEVVQFDDDAERTVKSTPAETNTKAAPQSASSSPTRGASDAKADSGGDGGDVAKRTPTKALTVGSRDSRGAGKEDASEDAKTRRRSVVDVALTAQDSARDLSALANAGDASDGTKSAAQNAWDTTDDQDALRRALRSPRGVRLQPLLDATITVQRLPPGHPYIAAAKAAAEAEAAMRGARSLARATAAAGAPVAELDAAYAGDDARSHTGSEADAGGLVLEPDDTLDIIGEGLSEEMPVDLTALAPRGRDDNVPSFGGGGHTKAELERARKPNNALGLLGCVMSNWRGAPVLVTVRKEGYVPSVNVVQLATTSTETWMRDVRLESLESVAARADRRSKREELLGTLKRRAKLTVRVTAKGKKSIEAAVVTLLRRKKLRRDATVEEKANAPLEVVAAGHSDAVGKVMFRLTLAKAVEWPAPSPAHGRARGGRRTSAAASSTGFSEDGDVPSPAWAPSDAALADPARQFVVRVNFPGHKPAEVPVTLSSPESGVTVSLVSEVDIAAAAAAEEAKNFVEVHALVVDEDNAPVVGAVAILQTADTGKELAVASVAEGSGKAELIARFPDWPTTPLKVTVTRRGFVKATAPVLLQHRGFKDVKIVLESEAKALAAEKAKADAFTLKVRIKHARTGRGVGNAHVALYSSLGSVVAVPTPGGRSPGRKPLAMHFADGHGKAVLKGSMGGFETHTFTLEAAADGFATVREKVSIPTATSSVEITMMTLEDHAAAEAEANRDNFTVIVDVRGKRSHERVTDATVVLVAVEGDVVVGEATSDRRGRATISSTRGDWPGLKLMARVSAEGYVAREHPFALNTERSATVTQVTVQLITVAEQKLEDDKAARQQRTVLAAKERERLAKQATSAPSSPAHSTPTASGAQGAVAAADALSITVTTSSFHAAGTPVAGARACIVHAERGVATVVGSALSDSGGKALVRGNLAGWRDASLSVYVAHPSHSIGVASLDRRAGGSRGGARSGAGDADSRDVSVSLRKRGRGGHELGMREVAGLVAVSTRPEAFVAVAAALGISVAQLREEVDALFEAQVAADAGEPTDASAADGVRPAWVEIEHPAARILWKSAAEALNEGDSTEGSEGSASSLRALMRDGFAMAVKVMLRERFHWPAADVDALLGAEALPRLARGFDADGDGMVSLQEARTAFPVGLPFVESVKRAMSVGAPR